MADIVGSERYCICPVCRSRYPFASPLRDRPAVLNGLDTGQRALWLNGMVFCGKCGAAFSPDVDGYIDSHQDELTAEVYYVSGGAGEDRPRWKHDLPPTHVPCEVSGRWLRFHEHSSMTQGGEFISVDVMTMMETPYGERERKICALVLTREDLIRALDAVLPRSDPGT